MKFMKLVGMYTDEPSINKLVQLEDSGAVYYYDPEANRELIIASKSAVEEVIGDELDGDFVDETGNVIVIVTESAVYAVANKDVSPYFDQLVAKLEVAEMATEGV